MTVPTEAPSVPRNGRLLAGDRVVIVDAPSWCRRYLTGRVGRIVRVLPFAGGHAWVRFERPVAPWCQRMEPIEEFPFSPEQIAAA